MLRWKMAVSCMAMIYSTELVPLDTHAEVPSSGCGAEVLEHDKIRHR
jgi:hypothetical protein